MAYVPAGVVDEVWIVTKSFTPETLSVTAFVAKLTVTPVGSAPLERVTDCAAPAIVAVVVVVELPRATEPEVGLRVNLTPGMLFSVTVPAPVTVIVVDLQLVQAIDIEVDSDHDWKT
jgi:hypothetical protein